MKSPKLIVVAGQPSHRLASSDVELYVTRLGGHVGPIVFDPKGAKFSPMAVAPWAEEETRDIPPMLKVLRGDWFCMPFGGNEKAYRKEKYQPHGETANRAWTFKGTQREKDRTTLKLSMDFQARAGRVEKRVMLVDGHRAVYQRHTLTGFSGPMNLGHHAVLKLPDEPECGLISTSPFVWGQAFPGQFESPAAKGYSALLSGTRFDTLARVPMICGGTTDLSRYPARRGFEDLAMLVSATKAPFAWTAVSFPKQKQVWFALKDPRVLRSTLMWFSNGGRHYAPWNGRHVNVLGLEEVTSYFHTGLAESAAENPLSMSGHATVLQLDPKTPTQVNYIMAAAPIPRGFDRVKTIDQENGGVVLTSDSGKRAIAHVDLSFLTG